MGESRFSHVDACAAHQAKIPAATWLCNQVVIPEPQRDKAIQRLAQLQLDEEDARAEAIRVSAVRIAGE